MSKTKNAVAEASNEEPHTNSAIEADVDVPDFGLDTSNVKEAKLSRLWFGANEKIVEPIYLLPHQRSGDVSGVFKSRFDRPGESKHVWGCVLMRDVKKSDCMVRSGEDFVSAPKGSLIYMFEPPMLRETLAQNAKEKRPLAIFADGKKTTKNGQAWNWRVWAFAPIKLDIPPMLMPSADAPLLPENAGATEHG